MTRLIAVALILPSVAWAGGPLSDLDRYDEPAFGAVPGDLDPEAIVNGDEENGFPNTVALGGELGMQRIVACTGSIITPRILLTAGHCSADIPIDIVITLGKAYFGKDANSTTDSIGFVGGEVHPDYVPLTTNGMSQTLPEFDVAVMELEEDAPVDPIWIHTDKFKPNEALGEKVTSVGYGITSSAGAGSGTKRSAKLEIDEMDDFFLLSNVATNPNGSNICSGDSGGPQFHKNKQTGEWEQWAVHSWGDQNCVYNSGSTRTDVAADWIMGFVEEVHGTRDVCAIFDRYEDGVCDEDCDEVDRDCLSDEELAALDGEEEEKGGCDHTGGAVGWAWLVLLPLLARRR